ncbi:haloalkane dehalogenase [Microbaculum marinum]|uniref:Haloalkane dehalogenase n=1 Tax=Microbaculum marinum TaxID=1764581 RepID=A0AAW9RQ15_9HYPH
MKDAYGSPHPQSRITVAGADIAYVDTGVPDGRPVVFLHGNPTSSYLWRNIIPYAAKTHRCLAPDLAGMGNSGPLPAGGYTLADHLAVTDAWFEAMDLTGVTLVIHDWGSSIGMDWARRNPDRVAGIVHMEAIVAPRMWADFPEGRDTLFRRLRSEEGEKLVLEENFFVETVLPRSILRELTGEEMDTYRAPFPTPESRLPTLVWPRQIPIEGEPADVVALVERYGAFMKDSPIPKLFLNATPGAIVSTEKVRDICRSWANQREVQIKGIHFVQEDCPDEIGQALAAFLSEN